MAVARYIKKLKGQPGGNEKARTFRSKLCERLGGISSQLMTKIISGDYKMVHMLRDGTLLRAAIWTYLNEFDARLASEVRDEMKNASGQDEFSSASPENNNFHLRAKTYNARLHKAFNSVFNVFEINIAEILKRYVGTYYKITPVLNEAGGGVRLQVSGFVIEKSPHDVEIPVFSEYTPMYRVQDFGMPSKNELSALNPFGHKKFVFNGIVWRKKVGFVVYSATHKLEFFGVSPTESKLTHQIVNPEGSSSKAPMTGLLMETNDYGGIVSSHLVLGHVPDIAYDFEGEGFVDLKINGETEGKYIDVHTKRDWLTHCTPSISLHDADHHPVLSKFVKALRVERGGYDHVEMLFASK